MGQLQFTHFCCDKTLAERWHRVIEALGGTVEQGFRPDGDWDTSRWTEEDWSVWALGGYATIGLTGAVVSFYRGSAGEIVGSHLGDREILYLFAAAGARDFDRRAAAGQSRRARLVVTSVESAMGWPTRLEGFDVSVRSYWPGEAEGGESVYRFPLGTVSRGRQRFAITAGMSIDVNTGAFTGYIYVEAASLAGMIGGRQTLESIRERFEPLPLA